MIMKISIIEVVVMCLYGILATLHSLLNNNLYEALISGSLILIAVLPVILKKRNKIDNNTMVIFVTFIFISQFMGSVLNVYEKLIIYDKIVHFISGICTSFLGILILIKTKTYNANHLTFNIIFILAISFMVAGLWEIFEYISDLIFKMDAQNVITTGINDTMQDTIMAFFGSLVFSLCYYIEYRYNKSLVVKKYVVGVENNG